VSESSDLPRPARIKYWLLNVLICVLMLAVVGIVRYTAEGQRWWAGFSSTQRLVFEGAFFELCGISLIWARVKAREFWPKGFSDWEKFVFEIALIVGGIVCMVQALTA
jgi:type VI protein secretion system component VasK